MAEMSDAEVVELTFPDEEHAFGPMDHSDFHAGLFDADGEGTRQQYSERCFSSSETTR